MHVLVISFQLSTRKDRHLFFHDMTWGQYHWQQVQTGKYIVVSGYTPDLFYGHLRATILPGDNVRISTDGR
jgi:hypothetical protein